MRPWKHKDDNSTAHLDSSHSQLSKFLESSVCSSHAPLTDALQDVPAIFAIWRA